MNATRLCVPLAALCWAACAMAQPQERNASAQFAAERLSLPAGERLGLAGAGLLFDVAEGWRAGPEVWGAATGERGGLFVGGLEVQRRFALTRTWSLQAGLFAGGGGGGAAPVGGGLMLRPALALLANLGGWQVGPSWSAVRFPSGDISSRQFGLLLSIDTRWQYFGAAQAGQPAGGAGPGFDLATVTVGQYRLQAPDSRHVGMIGARAERREGDWRRGFEAAAAASGGAAGYMEILGSLAWDTEVLPSLRVGARAALGLGGGGGFDSGGGVIGKVAGTLGWRFLPGWQLGLEVGALDGLHGRPQARSAMLTLATDTSPAPGSGGQVARVEWNAVIEHLTAAQRVDGTRSSLQAVGLGLNRALGENVYLTAQAHSAFAGGAGAYSVGLVGAGLNTAPVGWQFGAEALVGAAGGGGVASGGGAIVQSLAWAGVPLAGGRLRLAAGGVRSLRGGALSSPLVEIGWGQAFGVGSR
ncbi:MAG: hypothetical protein U1F50_12175 [Rubrivivax sp.]